MNSLLADYLLVHAKVVGRLEAIADALSYRAGTTDHRLGDRYQAADGSWTAEVQFRDRHNDGESEIFPLPLLEVADAEFAGALAAFVTAKKTKDEAQRKAAEQARIKYQEDQERKTYESLKAKFEGGEK